MAEPSVFCHLGQLRGTGEASDDMLITSYLAERPMAGVVTIPSKEYEFLRECARVLYEDTREQFRPEFIRKVRRARKALVERRGVTVRTRRGLREYLESL